MSEVDALASMMGADVPAEYRDWDAEDWDAAMSAEVEKRRAAATAAGGERRDRIKCSATPPKPH